MSRTTYTTVEHFMMDLDIYKALSGVVVGIVGSVFAYLIYHFFLDPLRAFPGPKLWGMTALPWHYHNTRTELATTLHRLHREYGSLMRIGPNELSFIGTSLDTWRAIYSAKPVEMSRAIRGTGFIPPYNGANELATADYHEHLRQRKALLPGFSAIALREQEPMIRGYFDKLVNILHENGPEKPIDVSRLFTWAFFDIVGDLALGVSFGGLDERHDHPWVSTAINAVKAFNFINVALYYHLLRFVNFLTPTHIRKQRESFFTHAFEKVDTRLNNTTTQRKDFIHYVEKEPKDGLPPLSRDDMKATMCTIMMAGSDSGVSTQCGALYFLVTNPGPYAKLCAEVRTRFPTTEGLSFGSVGGLEYLDAVIHESWRLYPPAIIGMPRIVPKGGAWIDGHFVPGNTVVGIHLYSTFRSPLNFTDPDDWVPERWLPLDKRPQRYRADKLQTMQSFSFGNRNCIGKNLAYAENRYLLGRLIVEFDFATSAQTDPEWLKQNEYFVFERKPLMLLAKPRV